MADLLFEIGTEELPSWYPPQATADLERLLSAALADAGISHGAISSYSTPRRLALLVRELPERSERREEQRRGPPVTAAFDADGQPTRAAHGFAANNGVAVGELTVAAGPRGDYVYATAVSGGQPVAEVLPGLLAGLVRELPAPRKMRWGTVADPFVRPVAWLLARLGRQVPQFSVAGQSTGGSSRGHRFLADHALEVGAPADYVAVLKEAFVIADLAERRELTGRLVSELAQAAGLSAAADEELLDEVTGLVEYPFPILGRFEDRYLELPEAVLTTVLIVHQRFFPLRNPDGTLAAAFIGVSNNRVPDEAVVRRGYEQVLAGRLFDARFFWDSDREKSLAQHAWGLSGIGYQRELGSMADKVARVSSASQAVAALAGLSEADTETLQAAVPLFRADLVTGMVNEFPELEGTMARAYALAEGQPEAVALTLEEGVLPRGPDSPLPQSPAGITLALADKLEKILGFIRVGRRPSGSADPFGLRRDGIGVARLLNASGWQVSPAQLTERTAAAFSGAVEVSDEHQAAAVAFLWERVSALLGEEGLPVRVIRAAQSAELPVITVSRRAHLLAALLKTEEFAELAALYKRVANITAAADGTAEVDSGLLQEQQEQDVYAALPDTRAGALELQQLAVQQLGPWDLGKGPGDGLAAADTALHAALARLLTVKQPLDEFLDNVHVMVDDQKVRHNRIALLSAVREALQVLGALGELEGL